MSNIAVPDLHKMYGVETLCISKSIYVHSSKTGQYVVLLVGTD